VRVDQWVPALHRGDAIGDSARLMRDAFRSWGHEAEVYCLERDQDLEDDSRLFSQWSPGGPSDVVLLHFALPSPLSRAFQEHRGRRVLIHHNITPPEFFRGFDPEMVRICRIGREELRSLAPHADLALGDSEYNRSELEEAGFPRTGVLPILMDFDRYRLPPNRVLSRELPDERHTLLFVGRISPNKRQEDLIRVASYWKRFISPDVRLILVGKVPARRRYFDTLQALAYELGFTPWECLFTGHVSHDDLLAYYRSARVFLSASAHEGFGVPLVESMLLDLPILARGETAVLDTLGGAGIVFREQGVPEIAEMAHALATDEALRARTLLSQRSRLEAFRPEAVRGTLRRHLESL
jgi:glycosyltransferase involved in cell wall biosynthesis